MLKPCQLLGINIFIKAIPFISWLKLELLKKGCRTRQKKKSLKIGAKQTPSEMGYIDFQYREISHLLELLCPGSHLRNILRAKYCMLKQPGVNFHYLLMTHYRLFAPVNENN